MDKNHKNWDELLEDIQFAINTSKYSTTKHTPAFLSLGRELQPLHTLRKDIHDEGNLSTQHTDEWAKRMGELKIIREEVQRELLRENERQEHYYNLRHRNIEFKVGDIEDTNLIIKI